MHRLPLEKRILLSADLSTAVDNPAKHLIP
ncbi:MAG: LEPR-XLL domain-containing protein [Bacillota bacterium]